MPAPTFVESSFRTRRAYEESLLLPEFERLQLEKAEATRFEHAAEPRIKVSVD